MLKCSQSHWTWWILGVLLAHQFKVKSKQLVHTFNKLNHLSKGLSQLFLPIIRQVLKQQLLNLHYQTLRLSKETQPVITTLCIQIFNNWIKLTILQEVVIQQFGGLLKNLANASTTMEMAWVLAQEEINRAGEELFGTFSTVTINFWEHIQADFFHKC